MRIGVIGAGAVGGVLAAVLDRAGHDVSVTARGAALDVIAREGLRLDGAWGSHTSRPRVSAVLEEPVDLAVFAVKAPDLSGALTSNRDAARSRVLVVRNGLGAREQARAVLGEAPAILGGLAVFAASLTAPGRVSVTAGAPLYLGGDPCGPDVAAALSPTLPVHVVEPFAGAEWTKLLVNQVNALPAITGLSVQECVADPTLRRVLTRSMRETVGVARLSGIRFARLQGLDDTLLRVMTLVPELLAESVPRLMARRMGRVPNPGSTLQSIRRGRPTEVDWLNGAVARAAEQAGGSAPINATLTALVHEVERTSRFLSAADIARHL